MKIKNLAVFTITLFVINPVFANSVGRLFKDYVPNSTCNISKCAQSIPKVVLSEFFQSSIEIAPKKLESTTYAFLIDFDQHSKNKRGYLLNLKNGSVKSYHVAHGRGSDKNHNGYATSFSNVDGSHKSSLGLYITAETYGGKHGLSLKLDGQEGVNDNARSRYIVMHGASYMSQSHIKQHGKAGRSHGCPAVDNSVRTDLINKLKGGSLYYIHKS